jgi:hypothetical protein
LPPFSPAPAYSVLRMARVKFKVCTNRSPELVWRALTEFGPDREKVWPDISPGAYQVLKRGDSTALVREGTTIFGIWAIEQYDWSQPNVVTAIVQDSNVVRPGGPWRTEIEPRQGGGTLLTVSLDRRSFGWRGRLLHGLVQISGGRILAARLRKMLSSLPASS